MDKKVVLITGCSSGFGMITANLLSENGYKVYASVRDKNDLASLSTSSKVVPIYLDITWGQEKINKVLGGILETEKRIDVLVNNAGFGFLGTIGSFTYEEVKEQFETNFFGGFKMAKAILPFMREQKSGLIVNISSSSGIFTAPFYGIYSASKFALEALNTSLRLEEANNGIRVVSINPGSFRTNFWDNAKFPKEDVPINQKIRRLILSIKHMRGDPVKVAEKIKNIIEISNPHKNYLVGADAYALFFISRFFPQRVIEFIAKVAINRMTRLKTPEK